MKVCITGATGLTGGHMMARLVRDGHQVVAFVRSPDKLQRMLDVHGLTGDGITHIVGDITDADAVGFAVTGCDAVVHTAAAVALSPDAQAEIGKVNLAGTEAVLRHAVANGCDPIVHVSSIAALSPPAGAVLSSSDPVPNASLPYAASKAACERKARALQDQGQPVVIIYPGGIIGPYDAGSHVVGEGWAAALEPGFMPVISEGGTCYVDARDLAAVCSAVMQPGKGPRRFMAGGTFIDWEQSADIFDKGTGRTWKRRPVPGWLLRGLGKVGDTIGRIKKGFVPPLGFEAAVSMTRNAVPTDDSAVTDELGITWRPLQDSFDETMEWLVASGRIPSDLAPRWPGPKEDA